MNLIEYTLSGKSYIWNAEGVLLITGKNGFDAAHMLACELDYRNSQVFIIDCAVRFDFDLLFELCRIIGSDEPALHRIMVQRAFTPYQIIDSADRLQKASSSVFYVYLAPIKQFLDPDVRPEEALHLFPVFCKKLSALKKAGYKLIISEKKYASDIAEKGIKWLSETADTFWDVSIDLPAKIESKEQFLF